jgi:hypothetical protein
MHKRHHHAHRWKPASREPYYLILGDGAIRSLQWHDTAFDYEVWDFGNCFRRRRDAEQARDKIKEILLTFSQKYT